MKQLLLKLRFIILLLFPVSFVAAQESKKMIAHFINVGQADATLLEFPCGAILIDAGAQGDKQANDLVKFLDDFFQRRTDLNNTIDLVIVTHAHIDHNFALDKVAKAFTIRRYIDNGLTAGSGKKNQNWLRTNAKKMGITYANYTYDKIIKGGNREGVTDTIIDPLNCDQVDPKIILLSGSFTKKPAGWTASTWNNGNNHSVVIKVLFGKASFLFTGDLETDGIKKVLNTYNPSMLDVDILRVGHHGAANATTTAYLDAVTPEYAIISCGKWTYGKTGGKFNTYAYGHPRVNILDQLAAAIPGNRDSAITIKAATGAKKFINYKVTKNIYATPWDQTINLEASSNGRYKLLDPN